MAEDQGGQRDNPSQMAWLKLFGAFKVALDPKKLLLAAGGIFMMALGWWVLAVVFYSMFGRQPEVSEYVLTAKEQPPDEQKERFAKFKTARKSWNLLHELAGNKVIRQDEGDLADSFDEYKDIVNRVQAFKQFTAPLDVKLADDSGSFQIGSETFNFKVDKERHAELEKARASITRGQVAVTSAGIVSLAGIPVSVDPSKADALRKALAGVKSPTEARLRVQTDPQATVDRKALLLLEKSTPILPFGRLRTWPWAEYRGPNPYLLVTGDTNVAKIQGPLHWFATVQVPVMLEPLCKMLSPVKYFLSPAAALRERVYLLLVLLWTMLTWALFGGAITRMAAVQVARQNEKVGLVEAVRFARGRLRSYFFAPILPLFFLAFITVLLMLFGWFEGFTWILGDLVFGLFLPFVLIGGLVMAAILVGLIGWPLMHATISAEGSDSFDALSRSYSYVYQALWHYLWYSFVAVVYGGVLIFFVSFMGSLLVYMAKWGVSNAPLPLDREPSYIFAHAPTSFGWRDLLISQSPFREDENRVIETGEIVKGYGFTQKYRETWSWNNKLGAILAGIWLAIIFLLVLGFGYSYFWTAATIIYLLLRKKVDDTELDEVHLEEEEEPFAPEPPPAADPAKAPLTMVESPTFRTPDITGGTPPPANPSGGPSAAGHS